MPFYQDPFLDLRIPVIVALLSEHLWGQGDYLHELLGPQFPRHGAEYPRAHRLVVLVDDDGRVLVELDIRAVGAPYLLHGADDDAADHVALLHLRVEYRLFHVGDYHVPALGDELVGGADHLYAGDLLGPGIIGHPEYGTDLYHLAFSSISLTRHLLSLLMGRASTIITLSPAAHSFFSSWAMYLTLLFTYLP